jgi:CRISPR-associated protein Cas1
VIRQLLNTLFVMTQSSYAHLEGETVRVEAEGETLSQVPLHHLGSIVLVGNVMVSPFLLHRCAEDGRSVVWLDYNGRFKARMEGPVSGNILLRRAQHAANADASRSYDIARCIVAGKIQNMRGNLLRAARDTLQPAIAERLRSAAESLGQCLAALRVRDNQRDCGWEVLDNIRGVEGMTARIYFESFPAMIKAQKGDFVIRRRTRRPPRDKVNALMSFLYALLVNDCVAAAEGVGLDPQVGFLHAVRPGRPSMALDLMEELRPVVADRLALTLINRSQIRPEHFEDRPGGAVYLNEQGRREVITAYQRRKQEEVPHNLLAEKISFGLVPHVQARIMARHLRGDCEAYTPYVQR